MPARAKIDENLSVVIRDLFRGRGYDAATVRDEQLAGAPDGRIWEAVQREARILITEDKGFANIQTYKPDENVGILLLRPRYQGTLALIQLMTDVLESYRLEDLGGAITVAEPGRIRVRRSQ